MQGATDLFPPRSWIPNAVTAANILAGFAAMTAAADGRIEHAVYLLLAALFLDTLDGRLARRLAATSAFGQQLDSFSDALSFGVAPAFLVYRAVLHPLGGLGAAAAMVFLLAGIFRLARFNLLADAHGKARRTLGLPIPIAASYLMAAALMRHEVGSWGAFTVVLAMAALMVSRWALPDVKGFGLVSAMLCAGVFNYLAVVAWPNWYTVSWWNVWNVLILLVARREDQRWLLETAKP